MLLFNPYNVHFKYLDHFGHDLVDCKLTGIQNKISTMKINTKLNYTICKQKRNEYNRFDRVELKWASSFHRFYHQIVYGHYRSTIYLKFEIHIKFIDLKFFWKFRFKWPFKRDRFKFFKTKQNHFFIDFMAH